MKKCASATKLTSLSQTLKWMDTIPYRITQRDEDRILFALQEKGEIYIVWSDIFGFRIW
jgi:hypothetical protein